MKKPEVETCLAKTRPASQPEQVRQHAISLVLDFGVFTPEVCLILSGCICEVAVNKQIVGSIRVDTIVQRYSRKLV